MNRVAVGNSVIAGFILILCGAANRPLYVDYPSPWSELAQKEKAENCGVRVTAFVLGYYDLPFDISRTAEALGTSSSWDQPVDMLHMKRVLERAGLHTEAYKKATVEEVMEKLGELGPSSVALLQLDVGMYPVGHYVVLAKGDHKRALFVDVGYATKWQKLAELDADLKDSFSGTCLFVSPAKPAAKAWTLNGSDFTVDVGEVALGPGVLEVPIAIENPMDKATSILSAKGSCSCFKQAVLEEKAGEVVGPHAGGKLVLRFDRSLFGAGNVTREVLLSFAGISEPVKVMVKGYVVTEETPIQLSWFPEEINLGAREKTRLGGQEITVFVPPGQGLGDAQVSAQSLRVMRVEKSDSGPEMDERGRSVWRFVVDLSNLPEGAVMENVSFTTNDKHTPRIVVPIRGEIRR